MNRKFLRMTLVVRTILSENGKLSVGEILKKVEKQFEAYADMVDLRYENYSPSTFNKDKSAIKEAWKIDLECDSRNRYYINSDFEGVFQNDLLNSAIFLASLNTDMLLPAFVIPETRKNTGMQHFYQISRAIEEKSELKISYFDYISEQEKNKTIQPYRLKQKDFKWYVLATDLSEVPFKSYALERIRDIETAGKFRPKEINFETPFQNAVGMFTNEEATKVILEFDHRDGHYLKANPIHPSQTMLSENKETIQFEFFIKPNEDFIMEIMKRSWSLKVIEPKFLREKFLDYWKAALQRNE
ncbi:WYL domain-containing protein [Kaistella carnis]|uniref:WYL domain-containing protein n=1 Tax=Kaistella carnis TaxID=1241979 RepID=A0A3G8XHY7_9FLAO|nr:WYL domain-containing protein [Kaistella carnis]AZI32990.1 WYL domain-containing protein [Kaistella carnis]